ncbi:MAG: hypothetical protein HY465_00875 [Deltaproteobacteria bacterium]|nr:hypothetical protein [Deltaproteobacteria bacterium]
MATTIFYDAPDLGHVRVEGPDAADLLQRITTNNVTTLTIGEGQHSALLDRKGHVLSLFYLIKQSEERFHLIAPLPIAQKTLGLIQQMIFADRVTVKDVTADFHAFCLLPFPLHYRVVLRSEVDAARADLEKQYRPITQQEFDLLRLKANIPAYGIDIGEDNILLEGNLAHTYARNKGCYPGQEVIERLHTYADGKTPNIVTAIVLPSSGETAGRITSRAYDACEGKTYAMVAMRRERTPPARAPATRS